MTLGLLGSLVLFSALAGALRRPALARGVGVFTAALFVATACGPVPAWMLDSLQKDYVATPFVPWSARNAIVLLGAGTTRMDNGGLLQPTLFANGRILRTVVLYRSCKMADKQCLVLVSGGDAQHHGTAESTVYAGVLVGLGVSARDIQTETLSMNTFENARYSGDLLRAHDPQTLALVTSGVHLRRSLIYFGHFGMKPIPVSGDQVAATLAFWPQASNLELCDFALHEYVGMARYRVYEALGWNTVPVPGSAAKPAGRE